MISKEEMRKRRLAALGGGSPRRPQQQYQQHSVRPPPSPPSIKVTSSSANDDLNNRDQSNNIEDMKWMSGKHSVARISENYNVSMETITDFLSVLWGSECLPDDQERWYSQTINFGGGNDGSSFSAGLVQQFGGPCGVLACIQAEILCLLLFDADSSSDVSAKAKGGTSSHDLPSHLINLLPRQLTFILSRAIARQLVRASLTESSSKNNPLHDKASVVLVMPREITYEPMTLFLDQSAIKTVSFEYSRDTVIEERLVDEVANYLMKGNGDRSSSFSAGTSPLNAFQKPGGVVLLTCSLVLSRGIMEVRADMDDSSTCHLTGQFGHSSQELINLFLTGIAASNVFDKVIDMGGGYFCKGVSRRSTIGYLTQLEALRYCEVGSFLKTPYYPIWVIGSSSHFSVLFGENSTSIEQSKSDQVLEQCRHAFRTCDPESNGFIQVGSLKDVVCAVSEKFLESIGGKNFNNYDMRSVES